MAQFVVRNIEERVKADLQRRAQRNGRSMEEEVRDILRNVVNHEANQSATGLGTEISKLFSHTGLDFDVPELHQHLIKPPSFDK